MSNFDQMLVAGLLALSGAAACHYGLLGWMLEPPPDVVAADQTKTEPSASSVPELAPLAPSQPRQTMLEHRLRRTISAGSYTMETVAEFEITGLVLAAKHYASDRNADLSKVDLALAWGEMSAPHKAATLIVEQDSRFYRWKYPKGSGLTPRLVAENTGNVHLIGASSDIDEQLRDIDPDEVVTLRGHLVNVEGMDGWRWVSSTSRADTGAGACEVILVDEVVRTGRSA